MIVLPGWLPASLVGGTHVKQVVSDLACERARVIAVFAICGNAKASPGITRAIPFRRWDQSRRLLAYQAIRIGDPGTSALRAATQSGYVLLQTQERDEPMRNKASEMEMLAGDWMTIMPVVIGPDARIEEAERMLELHEVTGLPVVDADGKLVGVISQTDLLRGSGDVHSAVRRRYTGLRVADLMSSPAITVDISTPLREAARLMRDEKIHRLVVVDVAERPLGVLTSMDFVTLYADG
ncbi:MAG TPA: CBS domain-containing protein [Patescibacteria group bacterium]|nr:CBS domain-containing protein [Patescibacteria group bacterium]